MATYPGPGYGRARLVSPPVASVVSLPSYSDEVEIEDGEVPEEGVNSLLRAAYTHLYEQSFREANGADESRGSYETLRQDNDGGLISHQPGRLAYAA